jgi:hypothetical protein
MIPAGSSPKRLPLEGGTQQAGVASARCGHFAVLLESKQGSLQMRGPKLLRISARGTSRASMQQPPDPQDVRGQDTHRSVSAHTCGSIGF